MRTLLLFSLVLTSLLGCKDSSPPQPIPTAGPKVLAGVHDPGHLVREGNQIVLFASAVEWTTYETTQQRWIPRGDDLYSGQAPAWDLSPRPQYWAPSVFRSSSNAFRIYHSAVYNEDGHGSRIGFAEAQGDPTQFSFAPSAEHVIESNGTDQPFAIDPAVFRDRDGRDWLVYGSHAEGIVIVELDPTTGLLKENPQNKFWAPGDSRFTTIANYGGNLSENNVEAAYIHPHPDNGYYYLFVNWDRCCSGTNSSYNIRVGRSTSPTGPFLDRDGRDMAQGGGTLFMDANGQMVGNSRFIGPGHAGIYRHTDGQDYFTHHFYDGDNRGEPSLGIWCLRWENDWPVIDRDRSVSW